MEEKLYAVRGDQYYSRGTFATIYKVSPYRVIKVFDRFDIYSKEEIDLIIRDEIAGSKLNYGLPVIKEIKVMYATCCDECGYDKRARGILKKFLPYRVSSDECYELISRPDFPDELKWDSHKERQMRKDEEGRIYVVDTQTEKIMHLVNRGLIKREKNFEERLEELRKEERRKEYEEEKYKKEGSPWG